MVLYSMGTAACAFAPNIWVLLACRIVSSLGIGGEWAAGAAMVAEVVPEKRACRGGCTALHVSTDRPFSRDVFDVSGHRRLFQRSVGLLALRISFRTDARRRRVRRPAVHQRTGTMAKSRRRHSCQDLRALFAAILTADDQRIFHGGYGIDHVVELQRFHPCRCQRTRSRERLNPRSRRRVRPKRWASNGSKRRPTASISADLSARC